MKKLIPDLTALVLSTSIGFAADATVPPAAGAAAPVAPVSAPVAAKEKATHPVDHAKATPEDIFKKLDTNNDGSVSLAEYQASPKGQKDAAKAADVFKSLDKDNNSSLSPEELKVGQMPETKTTKTVEKKETVKAEPKATK